MHVKEEKTENLVRQYVVESGLELTPVRLKSCDFQLLHYAAEENRGGGWWRGRKKRLEGREAGRD